MAYWLFKEEPDHYSYSDLEREQGTLWNGVTNSLARMHLRKIRRGDRILYYHTGKEKAIVGEMRAVGDAVPDSKSADPKAVAVEVRPVRRLHHPVSLRRVKEDAQLASWDLARLPRLSVMPVTNDQWRRVEELSEKAEE
jgi:predicted RNA-binding protein with PUA-like domain